MTKQHQLPAKLKDARSEEKHTLGLQSYPFTHPPEPWNPSLEHALAARMPGAFDRVEGQLGGNVLAKVLPVPLRTLDGAHPRFNWQWPRPKGSYVRTETGDIHEFGDLSEHNEDQYNEIREEFHAEGVRDLGRTAKMRRLVAIILIKWAVLPASHLHA